MRLVGDYHEPQVPCHAPAEAEARKTVMPTRPELRGEVESPLSAGQVLAVKLSLSAGSDIICGIFRNKETERTFSITRDGAWFYLRYHESDY